ncbi:MAG: DUF3362 domain-containing protein [Blautia massiliensis (ex Durand et al. 2017)]
MKLAEYVRDLGFTPEQVQDFYPTPSTLSTCMYYTGIHPLTERKGLCSEKSSRKSRSASFDASIKIRQTGRTGPGRAEDGQIGWIWSVSDRNV